MTPSQAAAVIGCTPSSVRNMIRSGRLVAKREKTPDGQFVYVIDPKEARRVRDLPIGRGRPRSNRKGV